MKKTGIVFLKEFRGYFMTPMAYVILTVYLLISGFFFYVMIYHFSLVSLQMTQYGYSPEEISVNEMVFRPLYLNLSLILLMVIPMITMKLMAEERKSGTAELLITAPVRWWEIIVGKYLAACVLVGIMTAATLLYPVIVALIGDVDPGPVLTAAIGLFLTGSAFASFGVLASTISENQIIAAVMSFGVLLLLWVVNWATVVTEGALSTVLDYLSVISHYEEFAKGVLDSRHILFLISLIVYPLFLSTHVLGLRHGR